MGGNSLNPFKAAKKAIKAPIEGTKKLVKGIGDIQESKTRKTKDELKRGFSSWDDAVSKRSPAKKIFDKMKPKAPEAVETTTVAKDNYVAPDLESIEMDRRRRRRSGGSSTSTIMSSGSDSLGG